MVACSFLVARVIKNTRRKPFEFFRLTGTNKHQPSVPYNKLLTNLASSSHPGEYWPSVVLHGLAALGPVMYRAAKNAGRDLPCAFDSGGHVVTAIKVC